MNKQGNNVGNLGDIIKHAAILALAKIIQTRNQGQRINYLDTHTYLIEGELANGSWQAESFAYPEYADIEMPYTKHGRYLCSTGIALSVLKDPALFLAESNPETRDKLRSQLKERNVVPKMLFEDARAYAFIGPIDEQGPTLAMVDPFKLNDEEWRGIWTDAVRGVEAIHKDGTDGIVLVFNYDDEKPATWFEPPKGFEGPVLTHSSGKFHFAVYCTEGIKSDVTEGLAGLGWRAISSSGDSVVVGIDLAWGSGKRVLSFWNVCLLQWS